VNAAACLILWLIIGLIVAVAFGVLARGGRR
jgi:hypothetical protein